MLTLGTSVNNIQFNPASISKNKEFIIETLGQMYNNIDNSKLQNIDQSFEQITKVLDDGTVESIVWPNYQTYLLSKNIPGGGTRQDFQLPLHTTLKPVVEGSDEVNRGGVYFVNEDSAEDFISEVVPTRVEIIRKSKAPATEPLLDFAAPTQQTSEVKVVNEVYDPITDDAYSLNLNYKGRKYDMVISRNGEIIDPSYYNSKTLKDVDVKPSFFKFTSQDIKNIFSEIEQPAQQTSEVVPADSLDDDNTGFNVVEAALKSETSIVEANEKETTIRAAGPQSDPVNIANKAKLLEQLSLNFEVVEQDQNSAQALNATDQDLKPSDPTNEKSLVNEQTKFIFEEDITEQYPDLANEYDRLMKNKNNYPVMVAEKLFPVEVMIEQYEEMKKINVNLTEEDFKEHLKCLGIK
jgi:hypothetical protein